MKRKAVIIGAGPAGLTAGWELVRRGVPVEVVEKHSLVGGIARTERYKDYYFDIGGHRFFTRVPEVKQLWQEWMGSELLLRPRLSRIFYNGKFFNYPLRAVNALVGLGLWESIRIIFSYLRAQLRPYREEKTFEQWVSNRFGRRLYEVFFKTYTEKVWGMPCSEIRAEWAAQRIKGLTLPAAVRNALFPPRGEVIKTLIDEFHYPERGPGMMWERVAHLLEMRDSVVHLQSEAVKVLREGVQVTGVVVRHRGAEMTLTGTDVFSTMPLSELIPIFEPAPPDAVLAAARGLRYRDFLTVVLIIDEPHLFSDNWIYVHSPDVRVGRIQNFKNWSPAMVPDKGKTSLGLEFFCDEGDSLWEMTDAALVVLGTRELRQIGIAPDAEVLDGMVVRQRKAYPIYDAQYGELLSVVKNWLVGLENFHTLGRNGLHKYNNQDHSMLTAILAVRNALLGEEHDVWEVNTERSYHEEVRVSSGDAGPVDILDA